MIWHKKTRDGRREEKKKNKTLEIYQSSNDDTYNIIKKISTWWIHWHHQKLTLELLVSHMYRLKMVVYSLVGISSPALKFAFHGVYKFILSRSFNGIKNVIIRVVMSLTFFFFFVSFSFLFSLSSLIFLCHVFSFSIHWIIFVSFITIKYFFTWKCIKIIYFFIFLKSFLISAHQNDLKTQKKINFMQKKIKKFKGTRFAWRSQTMP
jgi:hypothetical protein